MNNNLDIKKVLEAIEYGLDIEEYGAAHGIINLLEYHGFPKELVLQLSAEVYVAESKYEKVIEMYEFAIQLYKKQYKEEEIALLENSIKHIESIISGNIC